MALLIGTSDGLYRAPAVPFDDAERVLDCGAVHRVRSFDALDGVLAATDSGLYRSDDGGTTWDRIPVPVEDVWEPFVASNGRFYVGTSPPHLYVSDDGGETWTEFEQLHSHPNRDQWRSAVPKHDFAARWRGIAAHPDSPDRVLAGLEAGGLFVTEDGGETWWKCRIRDRNTVDQTDIHQVVAVGPQEYLVPAGRLSIYDPNHSAAEGGLYRTRDAGATWTRVDADIGPNYFREILVHEGTLYTCAGLTVPPEWPVIGADATMYVSDDLGDTFESVPFPGQEDGEIVTAWDGADDRVVGGTAKGAKTGVAPPDFDGRLVEQRSRGEWETVGFVPGDVTSLHLV